ncbi:alpha/beta fold hydrolase [Azospirillum sp. A23]|uniref:alpha/beta fold hydrolase n=1 Tax=Azospirillum sp. A23 TaxID=3160608 RepID=UPI0036F3DB85
MLYELALPALIVRDSCRWLHRRLSKPTSGGTCRATPVFRFRAAKCRLRRLDLGLLTRLSPKAGARLALRRFEGSRPEPVPAIHTAAAPAVVCGATPAGRLPATVLGSQHRPRLLLVHGWNADSSMLLPLAAALAASGFHVVLPDLEKGEGRGGGKLRRARHAGFAEKARRLARDCGPLGPFAAVIGHSAGGLIGAMAVAEGLAANRLVTVCAPASMASLLAAYLKRTQAPLALYEAILPEYRALRARDAAAVGPEDYGRFGADHLVIHARGDWQVRLDEAWQICAARPGSAPVILENCNHHTILRHPALARAIASFVAVPCREGARAC